MYLGNQPALSYTSFAKQDFTTSATTSYTLDQPVANENEIALFINFVRQEPTTAYTASGTTLTLTSATSASDDMYCVFLGKAVQTVNPPNGSVGLSQLSATGTKDATTFLRGDNTFATAGGDNTPAFSAYMSSGQSLTDNTDTKVDFDTEDFDTDNAFDTTNKRFTVPSGKGGKYFFYTRVRFFQGSLSQYMIGFRVNGSEAGKNYIYSGDQGTSIYSSIQYRSYDVSAIETLSAGDYVEVYVKADSTAGASTTLNSGTLQSEFSGYKLIGV